MHDFGNYYGGDSMNYPDGMRHEMLDGNTPAEDFAAYMDEDLCARMDKLAEEINTCGDEAEALLNAAYALDVAAAYIKQRYGV